MSLRLPATAVLLTLLCATLVAQSTAPSAARDAQVIGARAFSPMVENVDRAIAFYKQLGFVPDPAGKDGTYPWDKEPWHYELHGGQVPGSQMRYTYAKAPGAVPPATPLLVEPVEHKDVARRPLANRVTDPGVTTMVLLVRDIAASSAALPASLRQPVRKVPAYGPRAAAMTVALPGGHLVELLQPDPLPATTAPAGAKVLGGWMRFNVADLSRTLRLYGHALGLLFTETTVTDEAFGRLLGRSARVARARLPQTAMTLEFVEVSGSGSADRALPRIQDPGAVRLQLTVRDLEKTMALFAAAGPSTVVSSKPIITQPTYRVTVVQDFNGLFLVLTDNALPPH
jgi:catechol 2,3-dioxygenase-like lactoylglutathione lyase family enzyme